MRFLFQPDGGNARFMRLLRELPKRAEVLPAVLPYLAAKYTYNKIKSQLPQGSQFKAYRAGLELVRVRGGSGFSYSIRIDPKNRFVKTVKPHQVLVNVRIKESRTMVVSEEIRILTKYNPWTLDSLPFMPDRRQAQLVTQKARPSEVAKVTQERNSQKGQWQVELARFGIKPTPRAKKIVYSKRMETMPDIVIRALQMEFGLGREQKTAIWRTAISTLKSGGLRAIVKQKKYWVFPLTGLSNTLWKKWPPKTRRTISTAEAKKYVAFERKLGIKR